MGGKSFMGLTAKGNLLDRVQQDIENDAVFEGMEKLLFGLCEIRKNRETQDWKHFIRESIHKHPIKNTVHQAPFSSRAL